MGGVGLSVADVQGWSADAVREVFPVGQNLASSTSEKSQQLAQLKAFESWGGDAAEAAKSAVVGELPSAVVQQELGFSPTHTTFIGPGAAGQVELPISQPTLNHRGTRLTTP